MVSNIHFSKPIRILISLLICALCLPAPMVANASPVPDQANGNPANYPNAAPPRNR